MKESLCAGVCLKVGLQPDEKMTTNAAESVNHDLKEAANYKEMSLLQGSHRNWETKFHDFSMTFKPIP